MAELAIKMTNQDNQVAAAIQEVSARSREAKGTFDQQVQAATAASQAAVQASQAQATSAKQGQRLAESLTKQNEDLSQSYERQAATLKAAHDDGRINADQLKTSLGQLEAQHSDMAAANRKASHEASDAFKRQEADARAGIATMNRLEGETTTLADQYKALSRQVKAAFDQGKISGEQYRTTLDRITAEHREMAAAQHQAIGTGAVEKIATIAAGWFSIQQAISLATRSMEEYNAEKEKGRSETESLQESRRKLFQISSGDFAENEARADAAAEKYGVDRATARNVLFSAKSIGFSDDYEEVLKLTPIIDPESAGTVAGQVRKLFGKENLNVGETVNAVLAAARNSMLTFEGITRALPMVGEGGRQQGAGLDESLAGVSVLSSVFKSGETTGDRMKIFLSKLALDEQTKGKGFMGGFEALQAMPEDRRKEFLGESTELNAVYAAMTEFADQIRVRTEEIRKAREGGGTEALLGEFYGDQNLVAFKASQSAEIGQGIAAEKAFSQSESDYQGFRAFIRKEASEGDIWQVENMAIQRMLDVNALLGDTNFRSLGSLEEYIKKFDEYRQELRGQNEKIISTLEKIAPPAAPITRPGEDK